METIISRCCIEIHDYETLYTSEMDEIEAILDRAEAYNVIVKDYYISFEIRRTGKVDYSFIEEIKKIISERNCSIVCVEYAKTGKGYFYENQEKCVFCDYEIKNLETTPNEKVTRKDTASFEFFGKWICGDCHDSLSEFLEGEGSPDSTFTNEPKTMGK